MFPVNSLFPLDRRTASLFASTLCYLTRNFLFSERRMNLVEAVDFDVLVLLSGIMIVNFIMVHQKETRWAIEQLQHLIKTNPRKGFWVVSFASFMISPFLTNDGVCLLFVEPILNAFDDIADENLTNIEQVNTEAPPLQSVDLAKSSQMKLEKSDAFYFLISLACSSNIGSALCYTGNPQNMIVAQNSIDVLPPYLFFLYMILPSSAAFIVTTHCIQYYWLTDREKKENEKIHGSSEKTNSWGQCLCYEELQSVNTSDSAADLLSPRSRARNNTILGRFTNYIVATPIPFMMFAVAFIMIILIFCNIMSISGLVCVTAVVMVVSSVCGAQWSKKMIWVQSDTAASSSSVVSGNTSPQMYDSLSAEEKKENIEQFYEEMFNSIGTNVHAPIKCVCFT